MNGNLNSVLPPCCIFSGQTLLVLLVSFKYAVVQIVVAVFDECNREGVRSEDGRLGVLRCCTLL